MSMFKGFYFYKEEPDEEIPSFTVKQKAKVVNGMMTAAEPTSMVLITHFVKNYSFAHNYKHDPREKIIDQTTLSKLTIKGQLAKIIEELEKHGALHLRLRSIELFNALTSFAYNAPMVPAELEDKRVFLMVGTIHPENLKKDQVEEMIISDHYYVSLGLLKQAVAKA